jgi:ribosomal protein S24E
MEKGEKARRKTENLGIETKRKGWFSRWRYGRSRCAGFAEIYKEQKQIEALENELNKQGLGSGQNALEKMKERKQILNKGFKNETLQKILNVKQELLKLNSAVQQQGKKRSDNRRATKES